MARLVIGGYASDMVFHLGDEVMRSLQAALIGAFGDGKGIFFRSGGTRDDGESTVLNLWLPPQNTLRFEYQGNSLPKLNSDLVKAFEMQIEKIGGVIMPGIEDLDFPEDEDDLPEKE